MQLNAIKQGWDLLRGQGVSLGTLTAVMADIYGTRSAVHIEYDEDFAPVDQGRPRSYRDLERRVAYYAAAFDALGCQPGQRILLSTHNRFDLLLYTLALIRTGAVAVPVNPRLQPTEFGHIVNVTHATAAVVDSSIGQRFQEIAPASFRWIWTEAEPPLSEGKALQHAVSPTAMLSPTQRIQPDETAILLCTSGTTGMPKAAALTSQGLLGAAGLLLAAPTGSRWFRRSERDRIASALPLTHVMGLSAHLAALCAGVPLIHCQRFRPEALLDVLEWQRPNAFIGVPTMYADLERAGAAQRALSHVQLWLSGADSMPPERAQRFQQYGSASQIGWKNIGTAAFVDVYGMVELSGPMALRLYPPSLLKRLQAPAFAAILPGFEARVIDPEGKVLGWGKVGQLQVKGNSVLQRYEGNPNAGPKDGWFSTGDLATLWPGGIFSFTGRHRDRLKVAGFSVFPAEVEVQLRSYPGLADVVVVGIPDERLGEQPVALLLPQPQQSIDPTAFLDWAAQQVAGYRRPRQAALVDAIPTGNHGKVDRASATAMAIQQFADAPGQRAQ